jgi:hypothetical protein
MNPLPLTFFVLPPPGSRFIGFQIPTSGVISIERGGKRAIIRRTEHDP